jgi:hypothetical protein
MEWVVYVAMFLLVFLGIPALVAVAVLKGDLLTRRLRERRLVRSVERALGHHQPNRSWGRVVSLTAACWAATVLGVTWASPALAVWAGGVVVAIGAAALVKGWADPYRLDDQEFDRRLRELLDQA